MPSSFSYAILARGVALLDEPHLALSYVTFAGWTGAYNVKNGIAFSPDRSMDNPAIRIDAENRQCESVDMTWGADGYQYGLHLILNKEYPRRVPYYM